MLFSTSKKSQYNQLDDDRILTITDNDQKVARVEQYPVDAGRRFNVDMTSYNVVSTLKRRRVSTGYKLLGINIDEHFELSTHVRKIWLFYVENIERT